MSLDMEAALTEFLRDNADIFVWKHSDMPGIPCGITEHRFNIQSDGKPVQQRLHRFNEEKHRATSEELVRLLDTGFIREV